MLDPKPENQRVAALLQETAALLADQGANPFRVNAYRRAADFASRAQPKDVAAHIRGSMYRANYPSSST